MRSTTTDPRRDYLRPAECYCPGCRPGIHLPWVNSAKVELCRVIAAVKRFPVDTSLERPAVCLRPSCHAGTCVVGQVNAPIVCQKHGLIPDAIVPWMKYYSVIVSVSTK